MQQRHPSCPVFILVKHDACSLHHRTVQANITKAWYSWKHGHIIVINAVESLQKFWHSTYLGVAFFEMLLNTRAARTDPLKGGFSELMTFQTSLS